MAVRRQRVAINEHAAYVRGSGCVMLGSVVVELTVREEELLELLLKLPRVSVRWDDIEREMAASRTTIRQYMKGLRLKLGARSVKTHHNVGVSLQPQFVGTARFKLRRAETVKEVVNG